MDALKEAIKNLVEKLGYDLYDVSMKTNRGQRILSVLINHEKGIDIDDCVKVSETVSDYLDETDPIEGSYNLEIASAGAERPLRTEDEIHQAKGKLILVRTHEQEMQGVLEEMNETTITIRTKNNKTTTILKADITYIRLAVEI